MVVDPSSGNVIVVGDFAGTITPPSPASPVTSAGGTDFFVAALDGATGAVLSFKTFGGPENDHGASVACDSSGNVYVTGYFEGTVDFGCGALASSGHGDIFVMRLTSSGSCSWSKAFGDGAYESGYGISVDAAGANVAVAGYYDGSPSFGGGALLAATGDNAFVAMLGGADGHYEWAHGFGGTGSSVAEDVALTATDGVVVVGRYDAAISLGGATLPSAGGQNAFVAAFDSSGNASWSHGYAAGASTQDADAVTIDPSGSVVFTGQMSGAVSFGGPTLTSAGGADVYVAKLDASGNYGWAQRFGDTSDQVGAGVATDAGGNIVVGGYFAGALGFDGTTVTSATTNDAFVAKLAPSGSSAYWAEGFGGTVGAPLSAVAASPAGASIIAGQLNGSISIGSTPLTGHGMFVAKLAP